jgi:hypothetical protein
MKFSYGKILRVEKCAATDSRQEQGHHIITATPQVATIVARAYLPEFISFLLTVMFEQII